MAKPYMSQITDKAPAPLILALLLAGAAAAPAFSQACEGPLANQGFLCDVTRNDGFKYPDCFTFISPGFGSSEMDLWLTGLGRPMTCACSPTGTIKNPRYENSATGFQCTSKPDSSYGMAVIGKITDPLKKAFRAQLVDANGASYTAVCQPDPQACPVAGLSGGSSSDRSAPPRLTARPNATNGETPDRSAPGIAAPERR